MHVLENPLSRPEADEPALRRRSAAAAAAACRPAGDGPPSYASVVGPARGGGGTDWPQEPATDWPDEDDSTRAHCGDSPLSNGVDSALMPAAADIYTDKELAI